MNIRELGPKQAFAYLKEGWTLVDVRTPAEWSKVHASGAVNIPLDQLSQQRVQELAASNRILFICQGGNRSKKACEVLSSSTLEAISVRGGTAAWEQEGLPVERGQGAISLERQVRIVVGGLIFLGTLLAVWLSPLFLIIPGFLGLGLLFSGLTDYCGMALLLSKMPWNQSLQCRR